MEWMRDMLYKVYLEYIFVVEITDLWIGAQDDPSLVTQHRILVKKFSVQCWNF
jgi:hypothetical protein